MTFILVFVSLLFMFSCFGFAILSRMCGGGWGRLKHRWGEWVINLPILVCVLDMTLLSNSLITSLLLSVGAYGLGVLGWRTGLGQYNRLVYGNRYTLVQPEKVDFIVEFLFGKDPKTMPYSTTHQRDIELDIFGEERFALRCLTGQTVIALLSYLGMILASLLSGFYGTALLFFAWAFVYRTIPYLLDEKYHPKFNLPSNVIVEYARGVLFIFPFLIYLLDSLLRAIV